MPNYHRAFVPGGTFFFTVVTEGSARILCDPRARQLLRNSIELSRVTRPFTIEAMVILPDHLHAIWTLPPGDADFSSRWASIKAKFTSVWLAGGGDEQERTESRLRNRRRGIWQRRFWEHAIVDRHDLNAHLDYIHYNPVKHGLVSCPHAWELSSFHRWVKNNGYEEKWQCCCDEVVARPPDFTKLDELSME